MKMQARIIELDISCLFQYIPNKKEMQPIELINSQKDHKQWTSFVFIGLKVQVYLIITLPLGSIENNRVICEYVIMRLFTLEQ